MRVKCPRCSTLFSTLPGERVQCPNCGFSAKAPQKLGTRAPAAPTPKPKPVIRAPEPRPVAAEPVEPSGQSVELSNDTWEEAPAPTPGPRAPPRRYVPAPEPSGKIVFGLIVNLLLPGLGTIIMGRGGEGWFQLFMLLVGAATIVLLVGLAIIAGVWVWALAGGILQLVENKKRSTAASAA